MSDPDSADAEVQRYFPMRCMCGHCDWLFETVWGKKEKHSLCVVCIDVTPTFVSR